MPTIWDSPIALVVNLEPRARLLLPAHHCSAKSMILSLSSHFLPIRPIAGALR